MCSRSTSTARSTRLNARYTPASSVTCDSSETATDGLCSAAMRCSLGNGEGSTPTTGEGAFGIGADDSSATASATAMVRATCVPATPGQIVAPDETRRRFQPSPAAISAASPTTAAKNGQLPCHHVPSTACGLVANGRSAIGRAGSLAFEEVFGAAAIVSAEERTAGAA